jgi:hypothetical protein
VELNLIANWQYRDAWVREKSVKDGWAEVGDAEGADFTCGWIKEKVGIDGR